MESIRLKPPEYRSGMAPLSKNHVSCSFMEWVGRYKWGFSNRREIGHLQTYSWRGSIGNHATDWKTLDLCFHTHPLIWPLLTPSFQSMKFNPTLWGGGSGEGEWANCGHNANNERYFGRFHTTDDATSWCADFNLLPHAAINGHNRQRCLVSLLENFLRVWWVRRDWGRRGLEQSVVSACGAPVALPHHLPLCKLPTNVLHCHYPCCALRLYRNYLLICLSVSLSAFSAPTFNHVSITRGRVFSRLIYNNLRKWPL